MNFFEEVEAFYQRKFFSFTWNFKYFVQKWYFWLLDFSSSFWFFEFFHRFFTNFHIFKNLFFHLFAWLGKYFNFFIFFDQIFYPNYDFIDILSFFLQILFSFPYFSLRNLIFFFCTHFLLRLSFDPSPKKIKKYFFTTFS